MEIVISSSRSLARYPIIDYQRYVSRDASVSTFLSETMPAEVLKIVVESS